MANKASKEKITAATAEFVEAHDLLSLSMDEFFGRLNTSVTGLTIEEAENRLEIYGSNEIARRRKKPAIHRISSLISEAR